MWNDTLDKNVCKKNLNVVDLDSKRMGTDVSFKCEQREMHILLELWNDSTLCFIEYWFKNVFI